MMRKIIGIALAVVLATVGTFVLVLYVQSAEDRALAGERVVDVLVASTEIPRGTPAEDLAGSVRTEKVPVKLQAMGSVEDLEELSGRVTSVNLLPGEQISTQRFIAPAQLGRVEVPDGMLQVTVSLDSARALGGRIAPGDHVGVVASFGGGAADDEGDASSPTTHLILHKVLVTAVAGAPDPEEATDTASAPTSGTILVTLALDAPSVERVVFAAEHGTLWLSAEPQDAPVDGTRVQTLDTIYR
jgi:pilus assembly protein CpaB